MLIWTLFAGMTVVAAALVLTPLLRRGAASEPAVGAAGEISVYRDQLAEIDRDLEEGLVGPAEAEAARAEISRRILRAGRSAPRSAVSSARRPWIAALAAVALVPAVAVGTYLTLGHPNQPDRPLAGRKSAVPSFEEMVAEVERRLAANPNDARGWEVIAPIYMRANRYEDAVNAWNRVIALAGPTPRRLDELGESLYGLADGTVTPEAEDAFRRSLALDPTGVLPRMYLAYGLSQKGRKTESAAAWRALVAGAKGDEAWLPTARAELAKVDPMAPEALTPAPAPTPPPAAATPGPGAADVAAAAQMSPEDRAKMIEGMVGRLQERLAASGGSIGEWESLIRAQKVLGRRDDAKASLDRARAALAGDAAALARLDALNTGLTP